MQSLQEPEAPGRAILSSNPEIVPRFMKFVPNALTIGRIVLTPVVLWLLLSGSLVGQVWALGLFIIAATSDYLDGRLARSLGARSRLGQFLDPLADKILVIGTFVVLAILMPYVVPWWAVAVILLRDVAVTAFRTRVESQGRSVKTLQAARLKTAAQLTFLIGMLVLLIAAKVPGAVGRLARDIVESQVPYALLIVVVLVTVATGLQYLTTNRPGTPSPPHEHSPDAA